MGQIEKIDSHTVYYNGAYHSELSDAMVHVGNDVNIIQNRLQNYEDEKQYTETRFNQTKADITQAKTDLFRAEVEIEQIKARLNRTITMIHNCGNCGATLEVPENKPIFRCKFCGTVYVIGPVQFKSHY